MKSASSALICNRRQFLTTAALLGAGVAGIGGRTERRRPPNVIVVLTDDQGYGDFGWTGNPHLRTPAMDRLTAEGTTFTQFNVSPTCSPTRAALLTGRHEFRTGVTHTILGRNYLRADLPTLADRFRAAGYRTGMFGKWHLGDCAPCLPEQRGFDRALYHGAGAIGQTPDYWGNSYFDPWLRSGDGWTQYRGYSADVFFDQAWQWMVGDQQPFLAWIAPNTPHTPLQVDDRYTQRFLARGLPETAARFYGMIENLDENLGILMAKLERSGLSRETVVVYLTDNGSAMGGEPSLDLFNAGLRGTKASAYEGGVRAVCSLWMPGTIPPAQRLDALAGAVDLQPTLCDLCGIEVPDGDGSSLMPLIRRQVARRPDYHLITHLGRWPAGAAIDDYQYRGCAIRNQRFSLVGGRELYDLEEDPSQRRDLAAEHPAVARALRQRYDAWWQAVRADLDTVQTIDLPLAGEPTTRLDCHDWVPSRAFPADRSPPLFQQAMVSQMVTGAGYQGRLAAHGGWRVRVRRAGRYAFTLRQLPHEAPADLSRLRAGRVRLMADDRQAEATVSGGELTARLELELAAGHYHVEGVWDGQVAGGAATGAYFVYADSLLG
jgi:arylsulfatase A-like enzyme